MSAPIDSSYESSTEFSDDAQYVSEDEVRKKTGIFGADDAQYVSEDEVRKKTDIFGADDGDIEAVDNAIQEAVKSRPIFRNICDVTE